MDCPLNSDGSLIHQLRLANYGLSLGIYVLTILTKELKYTCEWNDNHTDYKSYEATGFHGGCQYRNPK